MAADERFNSLTNQEKISFLVKFFYDEELEIAIGSMIFIFEMLLKYFEGIANESIAIIIEEIFNCIT